MIYSRNPVFTYRQTIFHSLKTAIRIFSAIVLMSMNTSVFAEIATTDLGGNERPAPNVTMGALEPSTTSATTPVDTTPTEVPQVPTGIFLTIEPS